MSLIFITGNPGKFSEAEAILDRSLELKDFDLPEVQDLDPIVVVRAKLENAKALKIGACIVEDSSVTLECLGNRLPGPFIKWFEDALGNKGIAELVNAYGNQRATVSTIVGYLTEENDMHFFEGCVQGTIVPARGDLDFGYGPIFQPDGSEKTFGEMTREEKQRISSRAIAFRKLGAHLNRS